jgi:hypothetical protein
MSAIDSSMQAKGMQLQIGSDSPRECVAGASAEAAAAGAEASAAAVHIQAAMMPRTAKTRNRFIRIFPFLRRHRPQATVGADRIEEEPFRCAGTRETFAVVKSPSAQGSSLSKLLINREDFFI